MLLSAAKILQQNKDKFNNRVVLIFQPAEEGDSIHDLFDENLPVSGANALVQDGLMEKYAIKRVFGIHVMARLPAGKMWIAQGPALNSVDDFIIKVEGKQSHGAMRGPEVMPRLQLQTLLSRYNRLSAVMLIYPREWA